MKEQCRTIINNDTNEQCKSKTENFYNYQYSRGTMAHRDVPICDKCLKEVDVSAHLYFKEQKKDPGLGIQQLDIKQ